MKFCVAIGIAAFILQFLHAENPPDPKSVLRERPYRAYWLVGPDGRREYLTLLVTHGPVEDLAGHKAWSKQSLDNMAMTFVTYKKDSLCWDDPFKPVLQVGIVDEKALTVLLDGVKFTYEPGRLEDVLQLMKNPRGTIPISRRKNPLEGAHRTAKAFLYLLQEQLTNQKK